MLSLIDGCETEGVGALDVGSVGASEDGFSVGASCGYWSSVSGTLMSDKVSFGAVTRGAGL